jgi:hypothetical protein
MDLMSHVGFYSRFIGRDHYWFMILHNVQDSSVLRQPMLAECDEFVVAQWSA